MRLVKTQISLGIRPVCSEASLCAQWVAKVPRFRHADSEVSEQTDMSLCWARISFCWFCHALSQIVLMIADIIFLMECHQINGKKWSSFKFKAHSKLNFIFNKLLIFVQNPSFPDIETENAIKRKFTKAASEICESEFATR